MGKSGVYRRVKNKDMVFEHGKAARGRTLGVVLDCNHVVIVQESRLGNERYWCELCTRKAVDEAKETRRAKRKQSKQEKSEPVKTKTTQPALPGAALEEAVQKIGETLGAQLAARFEGQMSTILTRITQLEDVHTTPKSVN